ncbi:MAG: hypothetical protein ACPLIG_00485 [Candidatus Bathyarchaeales archaeon]
MRRDMHRCVKLFKTETCHVYDNGRVNVQKAQQLFIVSLFGSILFVTKVFFNPPWDNLLIVVQAVLLALAAFFIKTLGATYVGIVGGILTSLTRPALGPLTFFFTFLFGFLVDTTFRIFKVTSHAAEVNRDRTVLAMALNTAVIAFLSYYISTRLFEWLPLDIMWAALMVFLGAGSGISAGYAVAYLWNKYLKNIKAVA